MKGALLLAGLVALAVSVVSCQVLGQNEPAPADSTPVALLASASPSAVASPTAAETPTVTPTPTPATPTATPTITPTPTPTATPVPPSAALRPAVDGLSQKLSAFRTALNQGQKDPDKLASAQLALLGEADKQEQALKDDKSPQADLVREAIGDIRAGASGQTQLLNAASQALQRAGGPAPVGTALSGSGQAAVDLSTLASNLRERVDGYQQARRERNPENLLRRQKDLVDTLDQIDQSTANDNSPDARQLRDAATSLRQALGGGQGQGSAEQLASALAKVQAAVGASSGQDNQNGDLRAQADSLQRKATDFRAALGSGNRGDLARLQKDLLDEASRVEASVRADQSTEATTLRSAISGLRDGASGDTAKLDGAIAKLAEVSGSGGNGGSTGSVATASGPPPDLQKTAETLQDKVAALNRAIQSGSTGDQLRLQRELYDQVAAAQPALEGNSSKQADALRGAVESIKNGLSGDTGKLVDAERQLALVTGKRPSGAPAAASSATSVDLGPISSALGNRLGSLQDALKRGDPDAVARAQQDLQAEVQSARDALNGVQSAKADRLRAAITAAGEAASGDPTKVKAALDALNGANQ